MRGILLDIEGTTTPIQFVYDVLFPYARRHLRPFIKNDLGRPGAAADLKLLKEEYSADIGHGLAPPADLAEYCAWLMDRDRKSTALKSIQGKIWAAGYEAGELRGEVFPDVAPAFTKWFHLGLDVRIFSSGSVLAQKLLFRNTSEGDLTGFLRGYFDTGTGPKTSAESYGRIASEMHLEVGDVVFVSDVVAELDSAQTAGMKVALCRRPGNRPQPDRPYMSINTLHSLDALEF